MDSIINKPLTLKCGVTIPNRLTKAAMAELMAEKDSTPGQIFNVAYEQWATGGWGMILTGNVQIDREFLGTPRDTAVDPALEAKIIESWKVWATACNSAGTPTIVQLNHPGKQSPLGAGTRGFTAKTIAPSAVKLNLGSGMIASALGSLVFGTPREMTEKDIQAVVEQFAYAAKLSAQSGFQGVELHAAHGYLLAQFLSSYSNHRTDAYGGSPSARVKIVVDIIKAIRAATPSGFCIGIKFNSVDHQSESVLKECIQQLKEIDAAGVDFLEISGGTYEDPVMFNGTKASNEDSAAALKPREAFFLQFANAIRSELPNLPLMVTGGFRTRQGMQRALESGDCDIIGIGRPAALNFALPKEVILNPEVSDEDARLKAPRIEAPWTTSLTGIKSVGSGAESAWYAKRIQDKGRRQLHL